MTRKTQPSKKESSTGKGGSKPVMSWLQFLECLREVETGGKPRKGVGAVGDNGNSIGPLQIQVAAQSDALSHIFKVPGLVNSLDDHLDREELLESYCIAFGYLHRYAKNAMMAMDRAGVERMVRIWNGGPNGWRKKSTIPHWEKFVEVAKKKGIEL